MSAKDVASNAALYALTLCAAVMTFVVVRRELVHSGSAPPAAPQADRTIADWETISGTGHRIGAAGAPVTIVEFGDFECPACGAFARSALKGVRSKYGSQVALVFRHWPLPYHRLVYPAARAAECAANQARFASYFDALYNGQDSLGLKSFEEIATEVGVPDLVAFHRCNAVAGTVPAIEADIAAAKALQSRGTPTLIVNGTLLGTVPDSAGFDRIVQKALTHVANDH